ncbi:adenine phosphoribosyltransferase [Boudabousia marimammalium]|uniref:Adenine phosphoribosyltransferase n=1 Tax=Boudabousia marimammalium TaxID=156892 RepID=A0A1Q5PR52_9ACTO|nr:adenine phosphoribosyltransferase [Boudabousia marimammalium]OKL49973.1 adenine phosphoribosyltransferase [Boudabousia marimammalium]
MNTHDQLAELITTHLREIPDFPEKGILFRDITPLLADGEAFGQLIDLLAARYRGKVDAIAGLESRGFVLAAPLAIKLGVGMLTIRKGGKLPGPVIGVDYDLEYGSARMEIRPDSVRENDRVLIIDDVLATGGTAKAAIELVERSGASVTAVCVLMELLALKGRDQLSAYEVDAFVSF